MNCPQCGTENNADNTYCVNCATLLKGPVVTTEPVLFSEVNSKQKKPFYKLWWVWGIAAICVIVVAFLCLSQNNNKVTKDNMGMDAMYNTSLGVGIQLQMPKSEIDKLLGEPDINGADYEYGKGSDWISISYQDGKVADIFSIENNWVAYKDIAQDSTQDKVIQVLGEKYFTSSSAKDCYYFYDKSKNPISDLNTANSGEGVDFIVMIQFRNSENTVTAINIMTNNYFQSNK
jgi:hypothetical protein